MAVFAQGRRLSNEGLAYMDGKGSEPKSGVEEEGPLIPDVGSNGRTSRAQQESGEQESAFRRIMRRFLHVAPSAVEREELRRLDERIRNASSRQRK